MIVACVCVWSQKVYFCNQSQTYSRTEHYMIRISEFPVFRWCFVFPTILRLHSGTPCMKSVLGQQGDCVFMAECYRFDYTAHAITRAVTCVQEMLCRCGVLILSYCKFCRITITMIWANLKICRNDELYFVEEFILPFCLLEIFQTMIVICILLRFWYSVHGQMFLALFCILFILLLPCGIIISL